MIKRIFLRMLILGIFIIGIMIFLGGAAALYLASQVPPSTPMVNIHTPGHGEQIGLSQLVPVLSTSGDRENKIVKVELWAAEGEQLRLIEVDEPFEPEHAFSVPQGWQPLSPGPYRLIVRAFNDQGDYGQASVDVEVLEMLEEEEGEAAGPELADGEALPAPGGFEQEQPGISGTGTQGSEGVIDPPPPDPDPDPPPSNPGILLGGLLLESTYELLAPQLSINQVKMEALDFEVVESYEHVWCYASLVSSPYDRIPESGYFDTTSQFHWNIADYLGGVNSVEVSILGYQPLDIDFSCNGYRNNQLHHIGRLIVSHPPEDWNGQLIHGTGLGGEGFTISYRINPAGTDLEAPALLIENNLFQQKYFLWYWSGDEAEIDGFRIYQDDVLVASIAPNFRSYAIVPWWTVPPCDEEYEYHVVAYRDTMESAPSNFLRYQGAVCGLENAILHLSPHPACAGAGQTIEVKYLYDSPHGDASMGIRIFKDGQRIPDILSTYTHIQHGQGIAQIAVTYHGVETFTTDQVSVFMYDENGQDFYVQTFDQTIDWNRGSPDLIIKSARLDRNNNKLFVRVKNIGCARAQTSDLLIERHEDGWKGFLPVGVLEAKQTTVVELDLFPEDAGRWGGGG